MASTSKADLPQSERGKLAKQGRAMAAGSFPITNADDLDNAIRAVGRAKGGDAQRAAVRRFIMRRAKELNLSSRIPDSWNADGSLSAGS